MIRKIKRIPKAIVHRGKILLEKMRGLDFTQHHMVDELGFSDDMAKAYAPSPIEDLKMILSELDIQPTDAILDYGSGKGFAMVIMNNFNFNFVGGVELSKRLTKICRTNFSKLGIKNVGVFQCNAIEFKEIDRFNYFYLFNPFPEIVLKAVLQNIQESIEKHPRKIIFIYVCARHREIVSDHPMFEEIREIKGKDWESVIYSNEFKK